MRKQLSFEDYLINAGYLTKEQLNEADLYAKDKNINLNKALIDLGFVEERVIVETLSKLLRIPVLKANQMEIDHSAVDLVPENIVKKHFCFPFQIEGNAIKILVTDPLNLILEDEIYRETGYHAKFYLGYEREISQLIDKFYANQTLVKELLANEQDIDYDVFDISGTNENSPIIKITNSIFEKAVKEGASDIHIGATEKMVEIRYRIDGILHRVLELPRNAHAALVSRIKTMAGMDITERRTPQDGRIQININGKFVDMRVSTLPTVNGEKVTIRLLDKGILLKDIKELGFQDRNEQMFRKLLETPFGVILITGPTGSGKSTTLYTVINELNDVKKNIITIEDPVEYKLDGVVQVQVNTKAGMNFANGLRAILRQDPDIILIGEIRDRETAEIAVRASNTGHLVFATLHTNDSTSTIVRMVDMGIEPYMVAGTVKAVLNQRLVRRICENCKTAYKSKGFDEVRAFFEIPEDKELTLYKGTGCENCKFTGYKGRIAIHELLIVNDEIRRMIVQGENESKIRKKAIEMGLITLKQDGLQKALRGLTTLEEVKRFTVD